MILIVCLLLKSLHFFFFYLDIWKEHPYELGLILKGKKINDY